MKNGNGLNIGIVTTWFERGAAYVSKQFMEALSDANNRVFIFARGGETYAKGNRAWDLPNVHWSKKVTSPVSHTLIDRREFESWIATNSLDLVIFNEQRWMQPILWCKSLGIKTVGYVDYYREDTLFQFEAYDKLICNTLRHFSIFQHQRAEYLSWGTVVSAFGETRLPQREQVVFFHSAGMNPQRKGTDILIGCLDDSFKGQVIIHTQVSLATRLPKLAMKIKSLTKRGVLKVFEKTVPWPGLYHLGHVYVYPSRLDGIGLSLIESMAAHCAVITTNEPPMNEFVRDNGLLIDWEQSYSRWDGYYWPQVVPLASDLRAKMDMLASDPARVEEMRVASRRIAEEEYNWTKIGRKFADSIVSTEFNELDEALGVRITQYDFAGIKEIDKLILRFPGLYRFLRNSRMLVRR